jgi:hypothetical protein
VLCDFATDPSGYLTAFGHRLGNGVDPGAAAAALDGRKPITNSGS